MFTYIVALILSQLSFSLYMLLQQIRLKNVIIQSQKRLSLLPVGYSIYAYQSPQALYPITNYRLSYSWTYHQL